MGPSAAVATSDALHGDSLHDNYFLTSGNALSDIALRPSLRAKSPENGGSLSRRRYRLVDPEDRMAVDILQRKVDTMRSRIDRDGVCVRRANLADRPEGCT